MDLDPRALLLAVRAHDKEDASQRGEPDPWADDFPEPYRSERLASMGLAVAAYLSASGSGSAGWLDMSSAPKNRKVLAGYWNALGKWRTITACYHTQLPWSDDQDPEDGSEYAPEGWYEESDSSETIYLASCTPVRWMPLPFLPALPTEVSPHG